MKIRAEAFGEDELGLHSFENRQGLVLSRNLIEKFSEICSESGNLLIKEISLRISSNSQHSIPSASIQVLIRRSLFPLMHFYWNQVMRIQSLVSENQNLVVYHAKIEKNFFQIPEEFEKRILTEEFNEFILFFLSDIWGFSVSEETPAPIRLNLSTQVSSKNNLFSLGKFVKLKNKLIRLLEKTITRIYPFAKFPVLTFANSETALRMRGMYLFRFRLIESRWQLPVLEKNIAFREKIFKETIGLDQMFREFFLTLGLSEEQFSISESLFRKFLILYFPIQFLEGLETNYGFASRCFIKKDKKAILSSGDGDVFSSYLIAYAKGNGFKVIKAQHGGHYGYYRDNRPALDIELPSTDVFLTWGWTRMHSGSQLKHIETRPMPSPWLSERKRYWKGYKVSAGKKYDILWMPQMMKRFVGAPQGASSIRRDVLKEFSVSLIEIAKEINRNHLNTFVKPYNVMTVALMEKTYQRIKEEGGSYLTISDTYDKGLTLDLLKDCGIVLWDQPGTGFLECLSGGIPTLVFWDRLYCEEEEWTKEDFAVLEENKIIHRSITSLISEISSLRKDPVTWMQNESRQTAIRSFCQKYALTSDRWDNDWISYLNSIGK